jgi:hypothetical protein
MADYFTQMVVHQTIPQADITPLERLLLSHIFTAEAYGEGLYFFSEQGPSDMLWLERPGVEQALRASETLDSRANSFIREQRAQHASDVGEIEIDMSGQDWPFLFQDIVKRSPTLQFVTIEAAFTCSRMRSDGFGGMAMLISADAVLSKSTLELLQEFEDQVGEAPPAGAASVRDAVSDAPEHESGAAK